MFIQYEIAEAAAVAQRKFYEEHPGPNQMSSAGIHEYINKRVEKVRKSTLSTLKKHLPVADPKQTDEFLEQVKLHYEMHSEATLEMSQEKLWALAVSAMQPSQKVKWLERWNKSASFRETQKFPKPGFNDADFVRWLHKATWWSQVLFLHPLVNCDLLL